MLRLLSEPRCDFRARTYKPLASREAYDSRVASTVDTASQNVPRRARQPSPLPTELPALLDGVERILLDPASGGELRQHALDRLGSALASYKRSESVAEWKALVALCRGHRLLPLLHHDPFTQRAFEKPRGYAGDACMMDMIYSVEDGVGYAPLGPAGDDVFAYIINNPACQAVRSRRATVASAIDRVADQCPRASVLAVASGHLREASLSVALRRRRVGSFLAVDSDPESLAEVRQSYGQFGVKTLTASFTTFLRRPRFSQAFDLVYSTGLFDYLGPRTSRRLASAMHAMVRPGGSMLIANFLPDIADVGYMEAMMDWELVYRSRSDMIGLLTDVPEAEIENVELWSEAGQNIIFLRVTKKQASAAEFAAARSPGGGAVVLQELTPDVLPSVDAAEDRVDDPSGSVHDV
jgi:hypothetical protein